MLTSTERPDNKTVIAITAIGLAIRIAWLAFHKSYEHDEALNVATSLAAHGAFADAFREGSGPTAHLLPLPLLVVAGVYRLFGIASATSFGVLTAISLSLVFASYWFQMNVALRLGVPRPMATGTFALLCLIPLNPLLEVVQFRVWDGAYAVALSSFQLYLLVLWDNKKLSLVQQGLIACVTSLCAFINPIVGGACLIATLVFSIHNRARQVIPSVAISSLLLFAPWAIRNQEVMGRLIILRSNLGLETAVAFNVFTANALDHHAAALASMKAIHPFEDGPGYIKMKMVGGELAYNDLLLKETIGWARTYPSAVIRLALRHWQEFYFPPPWYWTLRSERGRETIPKLLFTWGTSLLGLIGAILALIRRDWRAIYPACLILLIPLPYALVQPTLRYHYLISTLSIFMSVGVIVEFYAYIRLSRIQSRLAAN